MRGQKGDNSSDVFKELIFSFIAVESLRRLFFVCKRLKIQLNQRQLV